MAITALLAISAYGQNGKKFFKAGELFMETMKYEDALAQFTSAIEAEPSNADYYFARGKAYEEL
ncbi:MAG TPA: tetratricopeptide repeat protein, partial [Bacteroidales bacterium]|nr:tetratricopeptide repeat protein [Bacteroidales bacterium]